MPKSYLCSAEHTNEKAGPPDTACFGTHHYRSSSKSIGSRYTRDSETLTRTEVNTLTPFESFLVNFDSSVKKCVLNTKLHVNEP